MLLASTGVCVLGWLLEGAVSSTLACRLALLFGAYCAKIGTLQSELAEKITPKPFGWKISLSSLQEVSTPYSKSGNFFPLTKFSW